MVEDIAPVPRTERFDLRLDRGQVRAFLAFAIGHVLFFAGAFALGALLDEGVYVATALFGLPWLIAGPRDRAGVRAVVMLLGIPLIHYGAFYLAARSFHVPFTERGFTDSLFVAGAIGGCAGALGSFALCALAGLFRQHAWPLLAAGTVILAVVGSVALALALSDGMQAFVGMMVLYTPWQLAFAYVLAKALRN